MYIGPEVMMPVASVLAGIAGMVMMFGRRTLSMLRLGANFIGRRVSQLVSRK